MLGRTAKERPSCWEGPQRGDRHVGKVCKEETVKLGRSEKGRPRSSWEGPQRGDCDVGKVRKMETLMLGRTAKGRP